MLRDDLRYATRSFLRHPGFSLVVVITLALGIAGTAAAFSLVNALLLKPIPYADPDRLAAIYSASSQTVYEYSTSSYQDVKDWRREVSSFESIAAFANWRELNLTGGDQPERVLTGIVDDNYFDILGVRPAIGREFEPEDNVSPTAVVLLGHALWQRNFGADPEVLSRTLQLNGRSYEIIGVMPRDFDDVAAHGDVQLWIPLMMAAEILSPPAVEHRMARWLSVVGKLKPGVTPEEAEKELQTVAAGLSEEYPQTNADIAVKVRPFVHYLYEQRDISRSTLLLMLAAAFVLLIACANVANLLIVRGNRQRQALAMRLAMGASSRQLMRHVLCESLLLALVGGLLGVFLARWAIHFLLEASPVPFPAYVDVELDPLVLLVTLGVTLLSGVAFGLAPALRVSRIDLREPLTQGGGRGSTSGRLAGVARNAFIAAEVALATVLLIGAVLMILNFVAFTEVGVGFKTDNMLLVQTELTSERFSTPEARVAFLRQAREALEAVPGISAAGMWSPYRPGLSWTYSEVIPEGKVGDVPEDRVRSWHQRVSVGGLEAIGLPLVRGRFFTPQDNADAPRVAIFSRSMAEATFPGQDPIGKRFHPAPGAPLIEVVGLVEDARHRGRGPAEHDPRDYYFPLAQDPMTRITFYAYTENVDANSLRNQFRDTLAGLDGTMALFNLHTMDELLQEEAGEDRFYAQVMGFLAVVALLLAAMGIYAVLSYSVSQRTNEIGIRRALGETQGSVLRLVGGQALVVVLIGLAIGLVGAVMLSRTMQSLLVGVEASQPVYFVGISVVLLLTALAAILVPVRRALRIHPVEALRYE